MLLVNYQRAFSLGLGFSVTDPIFDSKYIYQIDGSFLWSIYTLTDDKMTPVVRGSSFTTSQV